MATKPTNLYRWASGGGAVISEPLSGLKDTGFPASPTPHVLAGEHLNWHLNGVYLWIQYLDAFLSDAHTWTGLQTFGDVVLGGDIVFPLAGTVDFQGSVDFTDTGGTVTFAPLVALAKDLSLPARSKTNLTLTASWQVPAPLFQPKYYKDAIGNICFDGRVEATAPLTIGTTVTTLPVGFRPSVDRYIAVGGSDGTYGLGLFTLKLDTAGVLTAGPRESSHPPNTNVWLEGVRFQP